MNQQPQVGAEFYEAASFEPLRIESITEQIRLLSYHSCTDVLEVGVGKGLLKSFLKNFPQIRHRSLDIAPDLNPDFVGSVLQMPFADRQFETVLCCQVLEHLPFEEFERALRELRRVSRRLVIVSLPDRRRRVGLGICLLRLGWRKFEWGLPGSSLERTAMCPRHFWEIGHARATRLSAILDQMRNAGFTILSRHRLEGHQWHSFFQLRP
ncbi:MAG: methyltransferase domain-containing protein [Verrucomicrobia bacterium]|nr:methyltransferase domain-containing protein [Verrucomicrobiota bacterium]